MPVKISVELNHQEDSTSKVIEELSDLISTLKKLKNEGFEICVIPFDTAVYILTPDSNKNSVEKIDNSDILSTPIENIDFSVRTYNCLFRAQIKTVGEIVEMTPKKLLLTKNFGRKSLDEIRKILHEQFGLKFKDDKQASST